MDSDNGQPAMYQVKYNCHLLVVTLEISLYWLLSSFETTHFSHAFNADTAFDISLQLFTFIVYGFLFLVFFSLPYPFSFDIAW